MFKSSLRSSYALLFAFSPLVFRCDAAELIVTNTNDSGAGSLRAALETADSNNEADTIGFADSLQNETITVTGDQLRINSEVTLTGFANATLTISGDGQRRLFDLDDGALATISRLTLADGFASNSGSGAAIANSGSLTLNECLVRNHRGGAGAAIRNFGGSLSLTDCLFEDNLSDDDAAVNSFGSGPNSITRCVFARNRGDRNGGAFASFGPFTVRDTTFIENSAGLNGGALFTANSLDLINCTFIANDAVITGGAIDNRGGLNVINCTFSGNSAASGPAIAARFGLNLIQSTIAFNNATGINNIEGLTEAEIIDGINGAEDFVNEDNLSTLGTSGGILTLASGNFNIANSILANNSASQIFALSSTTIILGGNNISSDNSFASVPNLINSQNLLPNTDPLLGSLADNGGAVLTHALLPTSPAVDSGVNDAISSPPVPFETDARGLPRILRALATSNGPQVDLGAVETLPITTLCIAPNNLEQPVLTIAGIQGNTYRIWSSETLDFTPGNLEQSFELESNGTFTFVDSSNPQPTRNFYRVELVLP